MTFIDTHCHILPGLDDGPRSLEESVEMLDMARKDGVVSIFATPHIYYGTYDNDIAGIMSAYSALRERAPSGIELFFGAEIRVVPHIFEKVCRGDLPTLNSSEYLLIELPKYAVPPGIDSLIFDFTVNGIVPIVAHPERNAILCRDLGRLSHWKSMGAVIQVTTLSITGDHGRDIQDAAFRMIRGGVADIVATDAHSTRCRVPVLSKAYNKVRRKFGVTAADRVFLENPSKIAGAARNACRALSYAH